MHIPQLPFRRLLWPPLSVPAVVRWSPGTSRIHGPPPPSSAINKSYSVSLWRPFRRLLWPPLSVLAVVRWSPGTSRIHGPPPPSSAINKSYSVSLWRPFRRLLWPPLSVPAVVRWSPGTSRIHSPPLPSSAVINIKTSLIIWIFIVLTFIFLMYLVFNYFCWRYRPPVAWFTYFARDITFLKLPFWISWYDFIFTKNEFLLILSLRKNYWWGLNFCVFDLANLHKNNLKVLANKKCFHCTGHRPAKRSNAKLIHQNRHAYDHFFLIIWW